MENTVTRRIDRSPFDPDNEYADKWGNAVSLWFDIAEYLYHVREVSVPAHWQFEPGMIQGSDTVKRHLRETGSAYAIEAASTKTLRHVGNVLERYTRMLKHAGYSY